MPDGDREHHARHEEQDEHEPEPDPGAARALAMLDPRLSACPVQAHRVADGLVVGVLSVADVAPRRLSAAQYAALLRVSKQASRLLSFRRHAALLAESHEALALGEAQYRLIANTATDAILTIDDDGRIFFVNPALSRLFGYGGDELVGQHVSLLVPPEDRSAATRRLVAHVESVGIPPLAMNAVRLRGRCKDGRDVPVELSCGEGRVGLRRFFTGIIRDVSERQAFEQALIGAREEAVATSRLKSEFLANMSHEIRTPMNGVTGMLELLLEDALTEQQRGRVEVALASAQSLLTIINDILDLSKIEAGKFDLAPEWVDVRPIVDGIIGLLRPRVAPGVRLDGAYTTDVPARVFVDPVRFRQILTNLAGNAVKFTEHGQISVLVHASASDGRAALRVTVTDTGVGIAADLLPRIFDKFTQGDGAPNRRAGGTGLGLSISQRLAELMGGRIDVTSEAGRGSEFSLSISVPCATDEPQRGSAKTAAAAPAAKRADGARVLLVEDNPVNQQFACAVLASIGCNVRLARNGEEAVACATSEPFDLILMDCQMPVMDGYEATRRLRARGLRLPIIALTAHAMDGDRARCTEAGMDDYLAKPIRPDTLRAAVTEAVAKNAPPASAPVAATLDAGEILARLSGDRELLADIGRLFIAHCPTMVAALTSARDSGDPAALAGAAHAIKGSVGNFTDGRAFQLARDAEQRGRNGDAAAATAIVPDLIEELDRVCAALDALVNEGVQA